MPEHSVVLNRDAVLRRKSFRLQAALVFGGWTLFGLFSYSQTVLYYSLPARDPIPWGPLFAISLGSAWIWAALTPAALWVANRLRFEPNQRMRSLLLHGVAGLTFVLVSTVLERAIVASISDAPLKPFVQGLLYRFDSRLLAYSASSPSPRQRGVPCSTGSARCRPPNSKPGWPAPSCRCSRCSCSLISVQCP